MGSRYEAMIRVFTDTGLRLGEVLRLGERGAVTDAYRFIAAEKANDPISLMSRVFGVNRTAYHRWEGWVYLAAVQDAFSRGSSAGRKIKP